MLKITGLSFAYDKDSVLDDISFSVDRGEHLGIMGESGCGKSTLLKLIYGSLQPAKGELYWGKKQIKGPQYNLAPGESYMKYMSQGFDLMGVTTVAENISEFLSVFYPKELKERTEELLDIIEMKRFAKTKVKHLSIGQQQRVALTRALAQKPEVLLLDEPFSHIDNFRKNSLRRNLFNYLKQEKITCLTATHDRNDILPFADRVLVLKDTQILAQKPILELYKNPGNLYIASLFGEANLVPINIVKSYADTKRKIIVYAHEFKVSQNSGLPVVVKKTYPMGSHYLVEGFTEEQIIYFHSERNMKIETEVYLNISLETINQRLKL
ncbi:sulfate/molybdate ABC transporter ATP-binding protein [uncultured Eudoraea sp.]|uniref:sulfate/molybdate ABC transporter ATP-binding protein n=1 Tax=uncultured Eudoraea sp. TaxID=1035614 RepID=UPI002609A43B|nr:ABC transporter ATP-binding protein [uncultured Eudoraea sp.]